MPRRLVLVLSCVITVGVPVIAGLMYLDPSEAVLGLVLGLSYLVPGAIVVSRAEGHRVGWLLIAIGLLFSLAVTSGENPWVLVFASTAFPAVFALFTVLLFVVPSGRLPEGRPTRAIAFGFLPVGLLVILFSETLVSDSVVANPIGFIPNPVVGVAGYMSVAGGLVFGFAALLVRFRRSTGLLRAQLAPVAAGFGLLVFSIVVTLVILLIWFPNAGGEAWTPAILSYLVLPSTFLVAILRYRLYDVGRLVRRTVTYVIVIALLVGLFAVAVLGFDGLLTPLFGAGDFPVALSTLLVFAVLRPVASRTRAWVDHRFNRSGYEAEEVVGRLRAAARDEIDVGAVADQLTDTVVGTLHPSSVAIWVSS